jgi:hypothetical protein
MAFTAERPQQYVGQVVGDGHCVAYVREAATVPHTSEWIEGELVWQAPNIQRGTAIATFAADGRYANATDGSSHAAIFLESDDAGFLVFDQWVGHAVAKRYIRCKGGNGLACDDADRFAVIETAA